MSADSGKITTFLFFLLLPGLSAISQERIRGTVFNKKNNEPISHVSVTTIRGIGSMTDTSGNFSFWFPRQIRPKDSITISAIGFSPLRLSVQELVGKKEIHLDEMESELENVIVVSTLKGNPQKFVYYRGWNEKNTGGEIGQVIDLPKKNLTLGSVQIKINQNYDTCWLRLHIRAVGSSRGMLPDEELLKDEILVPATTKYGLMEFDLSEKNIKLPGNSAYVGFEVVTCRTPRSDIPSFSFMGSEEGENLYREKADTEWETSSRYTIYIRLLLK